jgi:hypothetical protein
MEFATTWPTYDLDAKTRALLGYARLLSESPMLVDDATIEALREAGLSGPRRSTRRRRLSRFSTSPVDWKPHPVFRQTSSRPARRRMV